MVERLVWPGTVSCSLSSAGYSVRLQQCEWPADYVFRSPETVLVLSLSKLPQDCRTRYRADSGMTDVLDVGKIVFMPRNVEVTGHSQGGTQHALCLGIESELEEFAPFLNNDWNTRSLTQCINVSSSAIEGALLLLKREASLPGLAASTMVESLGMYISVELARIFAISSKGVEVLSKGGLSPTQKRRITEYVTANIANTPTVSELAHLCGISRRHLARSFKQSTGETLCGYVERTRLGEARRLLADTRLPIKVVAGRLGYSGASAFSVAFRRAVGQTPSAFRSEIAR